MTLITRMMHARMVRLVNHDGASRANMAMQAPINRMMNVSNHLNNVFIVIIKLLLQSLSQM